MEDKVSKENNLNIQTPMDFRTINDSEVENLKLTEKIEDEELRIKESGKTSDVHINKEFEKNGVKRNRVLSEGEASSSFETISSVDCSKDIGDLGLTSEFEDFTVKVSNKLACTQEKGQNKRKFYEKRKRKIPRKKERYLGDHTSRHQDGFKSFKEEKQWQDKKLKNDHRSRILSEDEDSDDFKRSSSCDHSRSKNKHWCERLSSMRRNEYHTKCRHSRSNERTRSRRSISQDRSDKTVRSRSPSSKERKTDMRFNSCDRRNERSHSLNRKRMRNNVSKTSYTWRPEDNKTSFVKLDSGERHSANRDPRKRDRTPFLVEPERKLKEADKKNRSENETKLMENQMFEKRSEIPKESEMLLEVNATSKSLHPGTYMPPTQNFYLIQHPSFPSKSMDNLPLVQGPTGLPVHITITGEAIPHDMDGRRIPVGPNGYYLPLDPTGRLFPHIVSPGNQAVPIHMTEDGVLRLPNSEPVPVGPGHKFPVNIDGSIIVIGADSKPLYPCNNLPREPPLKLLQMMNAESGMQRGTQQLMPQLGTQQTNPLQNNNGYFFQPTRDDFTEKNFKQNQENSSLGNNNFWGRSKDAVKYIEIQTNTCTSNSIEDVKQFNLSKQDETSKSNDCNSDSDMVLDSGDSECDSTSKPITKSKKDKSEEFLLTSSDEEIILKKIFGENFEMSTKHAETTRKDIIIKRVRKTIKSLSDRNYTPPVVGRFLTSKLTNSIIEESPNESPLLKNRIKLSFITPLLNSCQSKDEPVIQEQNVFTFKFLPRETSETKENCFAVKEKCDKSTFTKFPVFTFDFAVQCDFTSGVIKSLNEKVSQLETELALLKNSNANLMNKYKNIEFVNKKQSDELKKALLEIQSLKGLFEKWD